MPDSPLAQSPYEVLGVDPGIAHDELKRSYRRLLRETHPDTGGEPARFVAVQRAWELVGSPDDRAAYDRGSRGGGASASHAAGASGSAATPGSGFGPATGRRTSGRAESSTVRARSYGHPGGQEREIYLALLREWVGRGVAIDDPYDPALVRSAPREIRYWLAKAIAEESTAGLVSTLGIGFTIWNNVLSGRTANGVPETIDHVVLGPSGLYAIQSEDWGGEVRLRKDEVVGESLPPGEEPLHELQRASKAVGRTLGVTFGSLVVVVPDAALAEPAEVVDRGRRAGSVLLRRSLLPQLLRTGPAGAAGGRRGWTQDPERTSIDRVFELRTRLQNGIRLA